MTRAATAHNRERQAIEALESFDAKLTPELRRQKYEKMAVSPFTFFRGSNHLYWRDLYRDWHFSLFGGSTATRTWLQGDAHLLNFGVYGSHDARVRFGLDDFDDGVIGDYQYDLWRLLVSVVLAMREGEPESRAAIREVLAASAERYLETLDEDPDAAADFVATPETTSGRLQRFLAKKAKKKGRAKMLTKWTSMGSQGARRFRRDHPKLDILTGEDRAHLVRALEQYQATLDDEVPGHSHQHFQVKDVARRLSAGTGSLGTDRFYVLVEGAEEGDHDDVILDVKAQQRPAAWHVMNERERAEYAELFRHEGERHMRAFSAMARHPDPYVGWLEWGGQVFSVRERSPFKADYPTDKLTSAKRWLKMARVWGKILAASHLRGARALAEMEAGREDGALIFGRAVLAEARPRRAAFFDLLESMALAYADCVTRDHAIFCRYAASLDG
jgi:uncharacterized protein (DUF2252 family)